MAPHAKFFALYDRPFWRDAGLWSGLVTLAVGLDAGSLAACVAALAYLDRLDTYQVAATVALALGMPHAVLPLVGVVCRTRGDGF